MTGEAGGAPDVTVRRIATEETFLNAYARRRAGDRYDRELISFDVADECYAIDITSLREITKLTPITEVPRVPRFVRGVVTVRGQVLPAIDLRERLGVGAVEDTRRTRILVCEVAGEACGLVVDAVRSVVRLRDEQIEPPPQMAGSAQVEFVTGIGRLDGELIILLDLPAVVSFSLDGDV